MYYLFKKGYKIHMEFIFLGGAMEIGASSKIGRASCRERV